MKAERDTAKQNQKELYVEVEMETIRFSELDIVTHSDPNVDWEAWQS